MKKYVVDVDINDFYNQFEYTSDNICLSEQLLTIKTRINNNGIVLEKNSDETEKLLEYLGKKEHKAWSYYKITH